MTTEKAIEFGKIFLKSIENEKGSATYEFVETAVKTLEEQSTKRIEYGTDGNAYKMSISNGKEFESCDDCISRQAVLDLIVANHTELNGVNVVMYSPLCKDIKQLPSVTPQPKMGHWIEGQTDNPNIHNILCSCCFEGYPSKGHANSQYTKEKYRWCPNCGCRMKGVE